MWGSLQVQFADNVLLWLLSGYAHSVREATPDFTIYQGTQFGRLCEIRGTDMLLLVIHPSSFSKEKRPISVGYVFSSQCKQPFVATKDILFIIVTYGPLPIKDPKAVYGVQFQL